MAEPEEPAGAGAESIGGISVEVTADIQQFMDNMKTFAEKVSEAQGKKIVTELKLGSVAKEARTLPIIPVFKNDVLTALQDRLQARHFAAAVKTATLAPEAVASLRRSIDDALASYEGNIRVTATVAAVDASGRAVQLNGVITGSPSHVITAEPITPTSGRAPSTAGTGAGKPSTPAKPTPTTPKAEPTPAKPPELTEGQKQFFANLAAFEKLRIASLERAEAEAKEAASNIFTGKREGQVKLTTGQYRAAKEHVRQAEAAGRPEFIEPWAAKIMGLGTGKVIKPNTYISRETAAEISGGMYETLVRSQELRARRTQLEQEAEERGETRDYDRPGQIYEAMRTPLRRSGKAQNARKKYGGVYSERVDPRTLEEATAEQLARYWAEPTPLTLAPDSEYGARLEAERETRARREQLRYAFDILGRPVPETPRTEHPLEKAYPYSGGRKERQAFTTAARADLRKRMGTKDYRKLFATTRKKLAGGGVMSDDELAYMAIIGLEAQTKTDVGPETSAQTINKESGQSAQRAGFLTQDQNRLLARIERREAGSRVEAVTYGGRGEGLAPTGRKPEMPYGQGGFSDAGELQRADAAAQAARFVPERTFTAAQMARAEIRAPEPAPTPAPAPNPELEADIARAQSNVRAIESALAAAQAGRVQAVGVSPVDEVARLEAELAPLREELRQLEELRTKPATAKAEQEYREPASRTEAPRIGAGYVQVPVVPQAAKMHRGQYRAKRYTGQELLGKIESSLADVNARIESEQEELEQLRNFPGGAPVRAHREASVRLGKLIAERRRLQKFHLRVVDQATTPVDNEPRPKPVPYVEPEREFESPAYIGGAAPTPAVFKRRTLRFSGGAGAPPKPVYEGPAITFDQTKKRGAYRLAETGEVIKKDSPEAVAYRKYQRKLTAWNKKYDPDTMMAGVQAAYGVTQNEAVEPQPSQDLEDLVARAIEHGDKLYRLYGTKGSEGWQVRRALRRARRIEEPYRLSAKEAKLEATGSGTLNRENVDAYRARAVLEGKLTQDDVNLLEIYPRTKYEVDKKAVQKFRAGLRAKDAEGNPKVQPIVERIPLATTENERQESMAADHVREIQAASGGTLGNGVVDVRVINFNDLLGLGEAPTTPPTPPAGPTPRPAPEPRPTPTPTPAPEPAPEPAQTTAEPGPLHQNKAGWWVNEQNRRVSNAVGEAWAASRPAATPVPAEGTSTSSIPSTSTSATGFSSTASSEPLPLPLLRESGLDAVVADAAGIHARPAAYLSKALGRFDANVKFGVGDETYDARNIIQLLQAGIPHGATVRISASGPDADKAAAHAKVLVENPELKNMGGFASSFTPPDLSTTTSQSSGSSRSANPPIIQRLVSSVPSTEEIVAHLRSLPPLRQTAEPTPPEETGPLHRNRAGWWVNAQNRRVSNAVGEAWAAREQVRPEARGMTPGVGGVGIPVRVTNFGELNRLLTGQTNTGGLRKLFSAIGAVTPRAATKIAEGKEGITIEEYAAQKGISVPEAIAEIQGGGKAAKRLRYNRRGFPTLDIVGGREGAAPSAEDIGAGRIRMLPLPKPVTTPQQRAAEREQREAEKKERDARKIRMLPVAKVSREQAEYERAQKAEDKRVANLLASSGPIGVPFGGPTAPRPEPLRTLASYFVRERIGRYRAPRQVREHETRDPAEVALERSAIAAQRASFPERAPSIAFGQLFARAIGFKTRYQQAQEELTARNALLLKTREQLKVEQENRDTTKEYIQQFRVHYDTKRAAGTVTDLDRRAAKELGETYARQAASAKKTASAVESQTAAVKATTAEVEKAAGFTEKIGNIASLFVGTKLFTVGMAAMATSFSTLGEAIKPEIDRLMGFNAVTTRVTKALAEQTVSLGGNAKAAIAAAAAQAGLSESAARYVEESLGPAVTAKAGAQTMAQARELFRASAIGGTPQGLFGGYGGLFGGPLFGEQLGGGKGFTEIIASMADDAARRLKEAQAAVPASTDAYAAAVAMPPVVPIGMTKEDYAASQGITMADLEARISAQTKTYKEASTASAPDQTKIAQARRGIDAVVDTVQQAYQRGITSTADTAMAAKNLKFEFLGVGEETKRFGEIATNAGDEWARQLADAGFAIKGITEESYKKFMAIAAVGAPQQEPAVVMQQFYRDIKQALQASALKANFAQQYAIPGQWGLGLTAAPMGRVAQGALSTAYLEATGQQGRAGEIATIQADRDKIAQSAADAWKQYRGVLEKALAGGPAAEQQTDILDRFDTAASKVAKTGADIAEQTKIINEAQGRIQALEASNTRILSARALQTARGLAGVRGGNELGRLQRSDIFLGQQSTALGLALQQRSITTNLAVAQFQAQGDTPEERYARQQEAIIQAKIAQQQLDIAKKQFENQKRETEITTTGGATAYGLEDAERAAAIASANLTAATDIAEAQAKILNYSKDQELAVQSLNTSIGIAQGIIDTVFDSAAKAAALGLGSVADAAKSAARALNLFVPSSEPGVSYTPIVGGAGEREGQGQGSGGRGQSGTPTESTPDSRRRATSPPPSGTVSSQTPKPAGIKPGLLEGSGNYVTPKPTPSGTATGATQTQPTPKPSAPSPKPGLLESSGNYVTPATRTASTTWSASKIGQGVQAGSPKNASVELTINVNNPSIRSDQDIVKLANEVLRIISTKMALIGGRSVSQ